MPLSGGIDAFKGYTQIFTKVDRWVWSDFLIAKQDIFDFFQENESLLLEPYAFVPAEESRSRKDVFPKEPPSKNAIWEMLNRNGLSVHEELALRAFSEWNSVGAGRPNRSTYMARYALVDLTLYFVYLMNFYTSNIPLFKNTLPLYPLDPRSEIGYMMGHDEKEPLRQPRFQRPRVLRALP